MKTMLKTTLALATFLAVAGVVILPANAQNHEDRDVAVRVFGGSTAKFVATPHSLNTSGYTDFAVNLKLFRDGTASGEFICAVPNNVVLAIVVTHWSENPDGSVKLTGTEYGYDVAGFTGTGTVVLRAGGVGVGGFDFADDVFPAGQFDTEIIRFGSIEIRHRH